MNEPRDCRRHPGLRWPRTLIAAIALGVAAACSYDIVTEPGYDAVAEPEPDPYPTDAINEFIERLQGHFGGSWTSINISERDGTMVVTLTGFEMKSESDRPGDAV